MPSRIARQRALRYVEERMMTKYADINQDVDTTRRLLGGSWWDQTKSWLSGKNDAALRDSTKMWNDPNRSNFMRYVGGAGILAGKFYQNIFGTSQENRAAREARLRNFIQNGDGKSGNIAGFNVPYISARQRAAMIQRASKQMAINGLRNGSSANPIDYALSTNAKGYEKLQGLTGQVDRAAWNKIKPYVPWALGGIGAIGLIGSMFGGGGGFRRQPAYGGNRPMQGWGRPPARNNWYNSRNWQVPGGGSWGSRGR